MAPKPKNILFVYPNLDGPIGFHSGISILSSLLKKEGFKVKLLHLNNQVGIGFNPIKITKIIKKYQPFLMGISVNTLQAKIALRVAKLTKDISPKTYIVLGGPHPTFYPQECLDCAWVDAICLGEGEEAITKLARAISNGKPPTRAPNIWFKRNGRVVKNDFAKFADPEKLPPMDLSIWTYKKMIDKRNGWVDYLVGRGCPFKCSFCFNACFKDIFRNQGKYLRLPSPKKAIRDLKTIVTHYQGIKNISFVDDVFTYNKPWLRAFLLVYKKKVAKPFAINTTADLIDGEIVNLLSKSGCWLVRLGIEVGNEKMRLRLLKKTITNTQIRNAVMLLKKNNIKILTYNMIGLPKETKKDMLQTLRLNAKLKIDTVRLSTLFPFRGTDIYQYCLKHKMLEPKIKTPPSFDLGETPLRFTNNQKLFIKKLQLFFRFWLNFYLSPATKNACQPLIDRVEKLTWREMQSKEIRQEIERKEEKINSYLCQRMIPHYEMKFAPYFAVLT